MRSFKTTDLPKHLYKKCFNTSPLANIPSDGAWYSIRPNLIYRYVGVEPASPQLCFPKRFLQVEVALCRKKVVLQVYGGF